MSYLVKPKHLADAVLAPIPVDDSLPSTCVIGAGSSGLAAAKALYQAGVPFVCFERGSAIGGNWLFDNPNGQSTCYETLEINTSGARMAFSDFPMPAHYPPYPKHNLIHEYFELYVKHFGFGHTITFNTEVKEVTQDPAGGWLVRISRPDGEETRHYDAVMVANGHHWDPRWPEPYPGHFDGTQIHAHEYRSGDQLEGKDVVVVGAGNSAMDISVEGSYRANSVSMSVRRGQWVLKKFILGKPSDQVALPGWMPWWVTEMITGKYAPPSKAQIREHMTAVHERNKRQFYASERHTIEVNFDHYLWALARERKRGRHGCQMFWSIMRASCGWAPLQMSRRQRPSVRLRSI